MRISDWSSDVCSSDLYAETYNRLDKYIKAYNIFQTGLLLKLLPLMVWNRPTAEAQPIQPIDGKKTDRRSVCILSARLYDLSAPSGRRPDASHLPPPPRLGSPCSEHQPNRPNYSGL